MFFFKFQFIPNNQNIDSTEWSSADSDFDGIDEEDQPPEIPAKKFTIVGVESAYVYVCCTNKGININIQKKELCCFT